jgi:phage shock protein PspC (stress-responsive transcriptional regulator)
VKRLYRSKKDRKIAGICGGLAETYSFDPTLLRLLFVFLGITTGVFPLLLTYIIGWIIIPEYPPSDTGEGR